MREKLTLHPIYAVAVAVVALFITLQVYISSGILPALLFALTACLFLYARMRFRILVGDDGLYIRTFFSQRMVLYDAITQLLRTEEMGKGRERYIIYFRERNKRHRLILPSYKYRNVERFMDEVAKRSHCEISEPHLIKPVMVTLLFLILGIETAFATVQMFWRVGETVVSSLRAAFMLYNYYPIWIFVAIFMLFSVLRFYTMMKKGYHYLLYYRGSFFVLLAIVIMVFSLSVTRVDTQAEMYTILMQTRFESDRIRLEHKEKQSEITEELLRKVSLKTSIARGFKRIYSDVRFSTKLGFNDPGVIWVVPHVPTKFYASYLDSHGIVRYINESNTHVTQEEIRGAYTNDNQ